MDLSNDFRYLKYFECEICKKLLKVNQIIGEKPSEEKQSSYVGIYYCWNCKIYYLKFKTLKTKEKGIKIAKKE